MSDYNEKFLNAEEQVLELAEQLVGLKTETENYSSATEVLSDSHVKLSELVESIEGVVSQFGSTINALKEVGTAEILSAVDNQQKAMDVKLDAISKNQRQAMNLAKVTIGLWVFGCAGIIFVVLQ